MKKLLEEPKQVLQAREAKKGMHWILEIIVFVVLYYVISMAQGIIGIPVTLGFIMADADGLKAIQTSDSDLMAKVAEKISVSNAYLIMSLFLTVITIGITFLFCKLIQKRKLVTLGFEKRGAVKEYLKGIVAGFVMFSVAVLICVLTGALKIEYISGQFGAIIFLLYVIGFGIQGMAEEIMCRGYFMVSIGRRYSMTAAVIINSVAFAALHLSNPGISIMAIVNLTLFGIFASVCFIKTGNIWLIGALHSVWNLVQGNIYGIKVSGMAMPCTIFTSTAIEGKELLNGGDFGLEGGIAVTIVLIIGIVLLMNYKKEIIQKEV